MTEEEKLKIAEIVGELAEAIVSSSQISTALAHLLAAKVSGARIDASEVFSKVEKNNERLRTSLTSALTKVGELP